METPNVSGDFNLRCEVIPVKELIHFCDTVSTESLTIKQPLLDVILYLCLGTVHTSLKLADPKKSCTIYTQFKEKGKRKSERHPEPPRSGI